MSDRKLTHRIGEGVVIGASAGAVIIASIVLLSVFINSKQQETLDAIRIAAQASQAANEQLAGSLSCDLGAPTRQEEQPDGTVQTIRPEAFLNSVCLIALGFDPVDTDGDGRIEVQGGDGSG